MTTTTTRTSGFLWTVTGVLATVVVAGTATGFHLLVGRPGAIGAICLVALAGLPLGLILGRIPALRVHADRALRYGVVTGGLIGLVLGAYVVIVIGLGSSPEGNERHVLGLSMVAAVVAVILAEPARQRLLDLARRWSGEDPRPVSTALETFGARMTRAVPMDELLLQLAETLHATIGPAGAEIWTGIDGHLEIAVAVPDRGRPALKLGDEERRVAAHARVSGNTWLQVWLPSMLEGRERHQFRVAPIAHLGELLGLIVVGRDGQAPPYGDDEDSVLADLARQVGLALHNVRLDSALQASLQELQERNVELQASRARIVAASDESRRAIERNLHDGAQQHLVALAVKLGLAKQVVGEGSPTVSELLDELRADVQTTIGELRELAHGIYPPLLRDRGLREALATAANRSVLPVSVTADLPGRYPAEAEAAAYFCCLEALQNAGKYAGEGAEVSVTINVTDTGLAFEVHDNGPGFDPAATEFGHGFTNMADRLGAIGGTLSVISAAGTGTTIRGDVPCEPLAASVG
ncbi:MAG: sensor histidine kinase [Frankiaceae bacterium]|nr:sensor histidine kinase [Frankiaceae bacterium]MBV9869626.1 sensor histidine kinase [Frankiaceae bacterium]